MLRPPMLVLLASPYPGRWSASVSGAPGHPAPFRLLIVLSDNAILWRQIPSSGVRRRGAMAEERLTIRQVAEYLKLTVPTVEEYVCFGKLPPYQQGRFKKSEIDAFLETGRQEWITRKQAKQ
jgi:excisionase family DNA binding protein